MTHDTEPEPEYLTCAEVATTLRVSAHTVRRMCRNGELPAVEVGPGRRLLVPAAGFAAYMERRTLRPDPQPAVLIPGQIGIPEVTLKLRTDELPDIVA